MIARLLFGSLRRRLRHLALIAVATTVAAGTVAATAGLGARLEEGLQSALHAAGPNLVVRPQVGGPDRLPAGALATVETTPGVSVAAAVSELARRRSGESTPVVAVSPGFFSLHPDWEIDGRPPASGAARPEVLVGSRVGADVVASLGALEAGGEDGPRVVGRLTTGEDLDRALIVALGPDGALPAAGGLGALGTDRAGGARSASDRPDQTDQRDRADRADRTDRLDDIGRIEVRTEPGRVEQVAAAIEARLAGSEARPLSKVTATDARLTRNLQALMAGVGGICLLLALVTVASATLALLEERRKEMALFLSLGYTGRWVQGLVTGELSLVGLVSVVVGSLAGEAAAAALARELLGLSGTFSPSLAGVSAGLLVVVAVIAAAAALVRRRVERLDPALVLQGH